MISARKNRAAAVHQRLLNQARAGDRTFQELLQAYANERLLYRLAQSPFAAQFVLKGALLMTAWGLPRFRPTRDIDLLGHTNNTTARLEEIVRAVCMQTVSPDGLHFEPDSVHGERIKEDADYEGVRIRFAAYLGKVRIAMQIDVGFADVITPGPISIAFPTLFDMPAPQLRCYSRESVIAEKLQAMVFLGAINSRMKDFYDLWELSRRFSFDGTLLQEAISLTFTRRKTTIPTRELVAFSAAFALEKQRMWFAFLQRNRLQNVPEDFQQIIADLDKFLSPVLAAIAEGQSFFRLWDSGWH